MDKKSEIKFYEVLFDDGFSIAIKALWRPSISDATKFCQYKFAPVNEVIEIPESEVRTFFDCSHIDEWPVYGTQKYRRRGGRRESQATPENAKASAAGRYGETFYVVDMGDGIKQATRSTIMAPPGSKPVTRRMIYEGRWEEAANNYGHQFMCSGFPINPEPDRPMRDEWLDSPPFPHEMDEFVTDMIWSRPPKKQKAWGVSALCLSENQLTELALTIRAAKDYLKVRSNPDTGEFDRHADADDMREFFEKIEKVLEPVPDPNWKEVCKKCCEGEDTDKLPPCEYYGEPNGCNSPVYGEYPRYGDIRQLWYSNMQKMRAALEAVYAELKSWYCPDNNTAAKLLRAKKHVEGVWHLKPRNCDRFATEEEALHYYQDHVPENSPYKGSVFKYITWLFALADPNEETKKDDQR